MRNDETKINDGGAAFPSSNTPDTGYYSEGMSLRDYACIKLCVPETGKEWLDEIILKASRDRFAAKAMQARMTAFCALETFHGWSNDEIAADAYDLADAMIRASKAKP